MIFSEHVRHKIFQCDVTLHIYRKPFLFLFLFSYLIFLLFKESTLLSICVWREEGVFERICEHLVQYSIQTCRSLRNSIGNFVSSNSSLILPSTYLAIEIFTMRDLFKACHYIKSMLIIAVAVSSALIIAYFMTYKIILTMDTGSFSSTKLTSSLAASYNVKIILFNVCCFVLAVMKNLYTCNTYISFSIIYVCSSSIHHHLMSFLRPPMMITNFFYVHRISSGHRELSCKKYTHCALVKFEIFVVVYTGICYVSWFLCQDVSLCPYKQ